MQEQQTFRRVVSDGQFLSHGLGADLRLIGVSDVAAGGSGNDDCLQARPLVMESDCYGARLSGFSEDGDAAYFLTEQGGVSGCSDTDDEFGQDNDMVKLRMYSEDTGDVDLFNIDNSNGANEHGISPRVQSTWQSKTSSSVELKMATSDPSTATELHNDLATGDNFFIWLDLGAGRGVDLEDKGVSRAKLESERVRYLTAEELPKYEVVVEKCSGKLMYRLSGQLLHTFGLQEAFYGSTKEDHAEESPKWIWVVGPSRNLYVHAKTRGTLASFHHSSFVRGSVVLAAGSESNSDFRE